jgi:hypothetical protein
VPTVPLTSPQYDIVLSGGYRAREYLVICPSTVIFAARVNGTPAADVFASFAYDTVTVGAFGDIKEGQAILVGRTSNIRAAFFRGRARKPAISGTLYINETSDAIQDNDYVWVIDSYDIAEKRRRGPFVDWEIPYHGIPPMIKSADDDHPLQAAYAVLTDEATAVFDLNVVMQVLTKGAAEGTYLWTIPDATYTVGSDSDPEIQIEVDTPYNQWGRLDYEDDEGNANYFVFTLTAGDPSNPAHTFFRLCHEPVDYSADLDNGYNATVNYWDGVDDLLDQTRVAVVVDETYNGGDAELGNIRFVGYFVDDTGDVRGDEKYGQIQNAAITLAGFLALAGQIHFPSLTIQHSTTPTLFDQIDTPTPVRGAAHVILEHSTLGTIAPFDWGAIDDTYFSGMAMDVPEASLVDAAAILAKKINASFTQNGSGGLVFRRNANFLSIAERDALATVTPDPITLGEGMSFSLKHAHKRRVSSVTVGFEVFDAVAGEMISLKANAPASGGGGGSEHNEFSGQLLAPSSDFQDVLDEAAQRGGDILEYNNPVDTLTINMDDGFGFFSPANDQWHKFDIAAADLPRGVAITTSTRWLCISIAPKLNTRGGRDIQAVFRRETIGGTANIDVSVVPSATDTALEVLPGMPSYGGLWSPAPSINYDTTDPDTTQPFDANDLSQTLPVPAEQGAEQASGMPPAGCARAYTTFKYASNITMGFITVLNAPYTLTIEGSARIRGDYPGCTDLTATQANWLPRTGFGQYYPGVGLGPILITGVWYFGWLKSPEVYSEVITEIELGFNEVVNGITVGRGGTRWVQSVASNTISLNTTNAPTVLPLVSNVHGIEVSYFPSYISPSTTLRMTHFCMYTATGKMALYADAFYEWNLSEAEETEGGVINLALRTGLLIDNAQIAVVPPFNPNHVYEGLDLGDFNGGTGGTGSELQFKFSDTVYSDNELLPFTLTVCGEDAGS